MKVAITGTFGTGKTTQLFEIARDYKMQFPTMSIGLLQEMARFCPYPVNENATFEAQMWIFCTQLKEEIEYSKLYDITICDRTLFDSVAYAMVNGNKDEAVAMYQLALHYVTSYDSIMFRAIDKSDFLIKDGFRSENQTFRTAVEDELLRIYEDIRSRYPWFKKIDTEYGFTLNQSSYMQFTSNIVVVQS